MDIFIALSFVVLWFGQCTNQVISSNILIDGHIQLGGLVPIHSKSSDVLDRECGELYSRLGIQRLEAMLFAVDQINSNPNILSNITLGIDVYDTCSSETNALDKAVNFISGRLSQGSISASSRPPVVGVVGASYSSVSIQIAHLLRLFQIPQISFDSTSVELSDKKKFEYFSRTVPHDGFQAKAIVDVMKHFNWTYISSVYSDDTYGVHGMDALREETKRAGICIATAQMIKSSKTLESSETFLKIIDALNAEPLAKTVVVFTSKESHIRGLLMAAEERNLIGQIQWVGSDAWGNVVWLKDLQHLARDAITVSPKSVRLKAFEDYFTALNPWTNTRNPWFKEYWQLHFNCSLGNMFGSFPKKCSNSSKLTTENSNIDMRSASAIDAVNAFARALHAMHPMVCPGFVGPCKNMINTSGLELLKYIRNVSFEGATGNNVAFDSHGDVEGIYDLMMFKKHNNIYRNSVIGLWANQLKMNDRAGFLYKTGYKIMTSSCTVQCSTNEIMVPIEGKESCCWECVPCDGNSYVVNQTTCVRCPPGYWPITGGKGCDRIQIMYFGNQLAYSVPTTMFAAIGVVITVFVIIMLARNDKTPVVKASGRELAYLILVGILWSFIHTFVVALKPTDVTCVIRFFGCSIAFSICYAAIFIKTNRISRIFNRRNIARRPILILPTSQLVLVLGVVCIQVLFLLMLALLRTPKAAVFYPTVSSVYLDCAVDDLDFGLSQVYNFILILVCTLYAFKTRKIPSSFNEAKFIAFAMYSTCVIWLAFLAMYFMKSLSLERSLILCVSVSLVAYVLLGTLFGPKVYILLFKPHRNVRKPVTSLSLSSINQTNNPRCPKCSYAAALNVSAERESERVQNSSDDPVEGNYSNRMSLLAENSRPKSSVYGQDGQAIYKVEVEKLLMHMRKELQAAKYALKSANEKLRQKEQEHPREEEDESADRKRAKALKEVKRNGETRKYYGTTENLHDESSLEHDIGDNRTAAKSCYLPCKPTMDDAPQKIDTPNPLPNKTEGELQVENRTLNVNTKCTTCTKKNNSNEKWKNKLIFALSKNTEHSKSSVVNSCPGCGKTFNDSIDPWRFWRRSFSLSDIDTVPKMNGDGVHV